MTNEIKPQHHVDITDFESIDSTSKGTVLRSSWNPSYGYAREKEIEKARREALAQHAATKAEKNDVFTTQRFLMMEAAIADLQTRLKSLEGK